MFARLTRLLAAVGLALPLAWVGAAAASAEVTDGHCSTDTGVTIVIDFQELGGGRIVRCLTNPTPGMTGLQALNAAGFTTTGTSHDGPGFVCRINNRPGVNESIAVAGNEGYRERCIKTPPRQAFWSYWWAKNGGKWTFSQFGAGNRSVIPGGYEGWSFSLNNTEETNPPPGVRPSHPVVGQPTQPAPTPTPTPIPTPPPVKPRPTATSTPTATATSTRPPASKPTTTATAGVPTTSSTKAPPRQRQTARPTATTTPGRSTPAPSVGATAPASEQVSPAPTAATDPPATTPSSAAPVSPTPGDVTSDPGSGQPSASPVPTDAATPAPPVAAEPPADGTPVGTLVGLGAVAALGVGGGVVWWRRRGL